MTVSSEVFRFSETDDFAYIRMGDDFANTSWEVQEKLMGDLASRVLISPSSVYLLDLSTLQRTTSVVIAAIIRVWKKVMAKGGNVVLLAPSEETRSILAMNGFGERVTISRDFGDAHKQLQRFASAGRRGIAFLRWLSPAAALVTVISCC